MVSMVVRCSVWDRNIEDPIGIHDVHAGVEAHHVHDPTVCLSDAPSLLPLTP
jgi:hypothetical protein